MNRVKQGTGLAMPGSRELHSISQRHSEFEAMVVAAKRSVPDEAALSASGQSAGRVDNVVPLRPQVSRPSSQTSSSDRNLLSAAVNGDQAAFATLMQEHLGIVVATAWRITNNTADADDIAQETFLRLLTSGATLEIGDAGLRPWLRRVASNLSIDRLRKSARLDVTDDVPEQVEAPTQFAALAEADLGTRVAEALAVLPDRQRVAVSLFHFDELSQRDVAKLMSISEDALESLLARGRRHLRNVLKQDWQQLLQNDL